MEIFTKLKHWQVFLIIVGIMGLFVASSNLQVKLGFLTFQGLKAIFGVLGVTAIFLWVLSIGLLINRIPSNPYKFKRGLFVLSILLCMVGYSALSLTPLFLNKYPGWELITVLLAPFTFFGLIYVFYNVPRSLKSFEVGRIVGFSGWILYALLMFYAPIGVWIIQPKINQIAKEYDF